MTSLITMPNDTWPIIFSFLPKQTIDALASSSTFLHRICTISRLLPFDQLNNCLVLSNTLSMIISPLTLKIFTEHRLSGTAKYPVHLRVDNVKERMSVLEKIAEINIEIIGLNIADPCAQQEDVIKIFSLFTKVQSLYFTNCTTLPVASLSYPISVKKLFFRNHVFTSETITKVVSVCPQLRRLFIQLPTDSAFSAEAFQSVQQEKQLEITIFEQKKEYSTKNIHDLLFRFSMVGGPGAMEICPTKFHQFWNDSNSIEWMCHAEKFAFLMQHSFLITGWHVQQPRILQEFQGQVTQSLQKAVEVNSQHVLTLNCLGALKFFLSPDKNMEAAEQLFAKAHEIDPNNMLTKTLLLCLYDKKSQTDTSFKGRVVSLLNEIKGRLIDSLSIVVLQSWIASGNSQGTLAQTDEGKYLINRMRDMFSQTSQSIEKAENHITFNFQHLIDLAMRKANTLKNRYGNEEYVTKSIGAYEEWVRVCLQRYPRYTSFLLALENPENVVWETEYHPEELIVLRQLRGQLFASK